MLTGFGTEEIYDETFSRLDNFFKKAGFQDLVEKSIQEGVMPPFSDAGPKRRVGWQQLGVRWFVEWPTDYQTALSAESFCATLQLLLMDLRNTELAILPSDVCIDISLHDGSLHIEHLPDNERVSLVVRLPRDLPANDKTWDRLGLVQGVAASALTTVSALSDEQFGQAYRNRLRAGLITRLSPYAGYDRLFREFYSEEVFNQHYQHARHIELSLPVATMKTDVALAGPAGIHPEYNEESSKKLIRRRYKLALGQLKHLLPQILKDPSALAAVRELQREGWKNWHILQAAASIRLNYIINKTLPPGCGAGEHKKAAKILFERDGEESDPAPPLSLFNSAELKRALKMTQLATLTGLGFHCWQMTPNFDGVDRFLRRFNYWTDDVPYPNIFPEPA